MIIKRPTKISKQLLVSSLLVVTITLTTLVISAQAGSVSEQDRNPVAAGSGADSAAAAAAATPVAQIVAGPAEAVNIEPRIDSPTVEAAKSDSGLKKPEVAEQQQVAPKSVAPSVGADAEKPDVATAAADASAGEPGNEASRRKGRAETSSSSPATVTGETAGKSAAAPPTEKAAEKAQAKPEPKAGLAKASKPQALTGKSGAKSKLPANLGTVTSTGSGGPAHYMSKHDAYSAIAEKHGALAQDALRKSDKRSQIQAFGGIQKASGLGDMFSPLKGVGDSGLARTLGASMRSIMKSKYSVPAYVASALLGAVALMAFYESPISPLPVPPLPEPPVGRFPPEMPNLSPGIQVPFRTNQQQQYGQQNYNQRSYNALPQQQQQLGNLFQQQQQVLFPGSNNAQQRQMSPQGAAAVAPGAAAVAGQVQQLAANILSSVGKQQIAQRKSGPDYESISRSLFSSPGGASMGPSPKMSGPANQLPKQNSFLGFFGLGGSSNSAPSPSTAPTNGEVQQASAAAAAAGGSSPTSSTSGGTQSPSTSSTELKNQAAVTANGLSNSHLVNKVKSFFSRSSPASQLSSSGSSISSSSNSNPLDQYQRMSFVQALMKDTAFLPAFLTTNRKSSSSSSSSPTASALTSNKQQSLSSAIPSSGSGQGNAAARMQVDGIQSLASPNQNQFQAANSKQRPATSGYGLVGRTADRIAHALLETFTSGIAQRSAGASHQSGDNGDRKSSNQNDENPAASLASSLISDLVSSYGANVANSIIDQSQQSQPEAVKSSQSSPSQQSGDAASQGASARSDSDSEDNSNVAVAQQQQPNNKQQQQSAQSSSAPSSSAQQHSNNQEHSPSTSVGHVRKTRSIGFEYPVESNQELAMREQQPSKAAQINNVIDFVADSYTHNRLLFNFVMNQVGLSQAVPYVEQILASGGSDHQ